MSCLIWSVWLTMAPLATTSCEQAWQQELTPSLMALSEWSAGHLFMPPANAAIADDDTLVRFVWPVEQHEVSSGFGHRLHPILGRIMAHKGIDIPLPIGSRVHAVADGVVEESGYSRASGYFLVIRHTDGWKSRYFHLSSVRVREGEKLSAGEEVATSGSSGLTTGPHLHLEIAWRGVAIDPQPLLNNTPLLSVAQRTPEEEQRDAQPRVVLVSKGSGGTHITVRFNNKTRTVVPGSIVFGDYRVVLLRNGKYQIVSAV
ncbi:M23 family metallopeptidase [Citrobacter sp.]